MSCGHFEIVPRRVGLRYVFLTRPVAALGMLCGLAAAATLSASAGGPDDAEPPARPELALGRSADYDYEPPAPGSYTLPPIQRAGDGILLNVAGKRERLRALLSGRITVLSFIYTRCADPRGCPHATGMLAQVFEISRTDPVLRDNLQLISLSFDPEYDTPSIMKRYSAIAEDLGPDTATGSDWLFLTTPSAAELDPILSAYGQQVDRKPGGGDPLGPFYHTLRVYLVDREGMIRNIYSFGLLDPRLVVTDVRTLIMEDGFAEAAPDRDRDPEPVSTRIR